jgi:prepilin-type N-terminal cleavage/methylation domain-containing protein
MNWLGNLYKLGRITMTAKLVKFLIKRGKLPPRKERQSGFSLIELIVSTMIVSVIISTILALVVDLLGTNQKETAQTETQQEMQRAIDYISSELREAIYIYDNRCFEANATAGCPRGIFNYLTIPANTVPVLAFWKLKPLPASCPEPSENGADPCSEFRLGGRTYSLVVYYLTTHNPNNTWTGKARIARYELNKFRPNTSPPEARPEYIPPDPQNFIIWPDQAGTYAVSHRDMDILVDFVDVNNEAPNLQCPSEAYELTPSLDFANRKLGQKNLGFYACVRQAEDRKAQDALIFIRGNAVGKPGVTTDSFLPALQTQVMRRSVFGLSSD